jgi:hypothetical protein
MGRTMLAPLTRFFYEADPASPMALIFWVGPGTRWVDPTHSHPDVQCHSHAFSLEPGTPRVVPILFMSGTYLQGSSRISNSLILVSSIFKPEGWSRICIGLPNGSAQWLVFWIFRKWHFKILKYMDKNSSIKFWTKRVSRWVLQTFLGCY